MPVGSGAQDLEGVVHRLQGDAALEQDAQPPDDLVGPLREVGEGALADLAVLGKDSRSRTAGGEFRLGTRSMYMGIMVTDMLNHVNMHTESLHGYSIRMPKSTRVFRLQHVNRDNRPDSAPNFGLSAENEALQRQSERLDVLATRLAEYFGKSAVVGPPGLRI